MTQICAKGASFLTRKEKRWFLYNYMNGFTLDPKIISFRIIKYN